VSTATSPVHAQSRSIDTLTEQSWTSVHRHVVDPGLAFPEGSICRFRLALSPFSCESCFLLVLGGVDPISGAANHMIYQRATLFIGSSWRLFEALIVSFVVADVIFVIRC